MARGTEASANGVAEAPDAPNAGGRTDRGRKCAAQQVADILKRAGAARSRLRPKEGR